jgi:hypothetical protein
MDFINLIEHWHRQGITTQPATQAQIAAFEARNAVKVPPDFREYLLTANGMGDDDRWQWDAGLFHFWPIEKLESLESFYGDAKANLSDLERHGVAPHNTFVFLDHSIHVLNYCIHFPQDQTSQTKTRVFLILGESNAPQLHQIADSFEAFVGIYCSDPDQLLG